MFLRPSEEELKDFEPDWVVFNAPGFYADPEVDHTRQANFAILNFSDQMAVVCGTGYTGEIKKRNFLGPPILFTSSKKCLEYALFRQCW